MRRVSCAYQEERNWWGPCLEIINHYEPWDSPIFRGQKDEKFPAKRMWRNGQEIKRRTSSEHFSFHFIPFPRCRNYCLFLLLLSWMDQSNARGSLQCGCNLGPGEKWWGMKSTNPSKESTDFFSAFNLKHWKVFQVQNVGRNSATAELGAGMKAQ